MAVSINWQFSALVQGGATVGDSRTGIQASGYDIVQISIPKGGGTHVVVIPAPQGAGSTILFAATCSEYKGDVTFTYGAANTMAKLDGPLVLIGSGAVSLLGGSTLTFTNNNAANDVNVQVISARLDA